MLQEHLFLVCELLRANLYEFQKYNRDSGNPPYFVLQRVQYIARQVGPHCLLAECIIQLPARLVWRTPAADKRECYLDGHAGDSRLDAVQVLTSLAFLHSLGLIHSDLKPENILIKSYSRCARSLPAPSCKYPKSLCWSQCHCA